jgi:spermidine synthase
MGKKNFWITELDYRNDGWGTIFRIKKHLYSKRSKYQQIDIVESYFFGKMLVLDNSIQLSTLDEALYHEVMVHVPMFTHPGPKKVLIIGGGDGGSLREAVRHPAEHITMVELDEEVIKACKQFLPEINQGAFDDPRVELEITDAFEYLPAHKHEFDVAIVDLTDPLTAEAEQLFSGEFFKMLKEALTSSGVFSMQAGVAFLPVEDLRDMLDRVRQHFPIVKAYYCTVPVYYGGAWPLILASKKPDPEKPRVCNLKGLKVYSTEYHKALFKLPKFMEETLYNDKYR